MKDIPEFRNADRMLGLVYAKQDPFTLLQTVAKLWHQTHHYWAFTLDEHSDAFARGQQPRNYRDANLRELNLRGLIQRGYRDHYPFDYSGDQVMLQLNELEHQIASDHGNSNDFLILFKLVADHVLFQKQGKLSVDLEDLFNWNGYINKIDMNIFVAAYAAGHQVEPSIVDQWEYFPEVNDPNLQFELDTRPLADNHAHLKASGYITELNWAGFLRCGFTDQAIGDFLKEAPMPSLTGRYTIAEQGHLLRITKCLRLLLDSFEPDARQAYNAALSVSSTDLTQAQAELFEAIMRLDRPYNLMRVAKPFMRAYQARTLKQNTTKTIIKSERQFLINCFNRVYSATEPDGEYRLIFNLYLVLANEIKLRSIQSNEGNGFDRFVDAENFKSSFLQTANLNLKRANTASVFKKYHDMHVNKVELRITPEATADNYANQIQQLSAVDQGIDWGLIIHFIKFGYAPAHLEPDAGYPTMNRHRFYKARLAGYREQGEVLHGFMMDARHQTQTHRIVGIDTANMERNNPPELFAPLYRRFQDVKATHNFHFTYHVGESFQTLVDGLRHIDEVITRLQFTAGDRLGHALALGTDVSTYYDTTQRSLLITDHQSLLDDIAWLYDITNAENSTETDVDTAYLERIFTKHVRWFEQACAQRPALQLNNISISDYLDFYRLRGNDLEWILTHVYGCRQYLDDPSEITPLRHPLSSRELDARFVSAEDPHVVAAINNYRAVQMYWCYQFVPEVFEQGSAAVELAVTKHLTSTIAHAQHCLQKKVLAAQIAIEANPSSNLKIGTSKHYKDLPLWRLNKFGLADNPTLDLPISVNTDDSAVFQTTLQYEYALLGLSLLKVGEPSELVHQYLRHIQENSVKHSFIER